MVLIWRKSADPHLLALPGFSQTMTLKYSGALIMCNGNTTSNESSVFHRYVPWLDYHLQKCLVCPHPTDRPPHTKIFLSDSHLRVFPIHIQATQLRTGTYKSGSLVIIYLLICQRFSCLLLFIFFIFNDRPTHLWKSEGDGKQNLRWKWTEWGENTHHG